MQVDNFVGGATIARQLLGSPCFNIYLMLTIVNVTNICQDTKNYFICMTMRRLCDGDWKIADLLSILL